jgi:hypothetical protein
MLKSKVGQHVTVTQGTRLIFHVFTGTSHENESIVDTVINTSGNASKVLTFNYASLALNNSYFLSQLVGYIFIKHHSMG